MGKKKTKNLTPAISQNELIASIACLVLVQIVAVSYLVSTVAR